MDTEDERNEMIHAIIVAVVTVTIALIAAEIGVQCSGAGG